MWDKIKTAVGGVFGKVSEAFGGVFGKVGEAFGGVFGKLPGLNKTGAAPGKAAGKKNTLCIAVDANHKKIEFYTMPGGDRAAVTRTEKAFKAAVFSEAFYTELTSIISDFALTLADKDDTAAIVVLPDTAVSTTTINVPNMNRRRNEVALDATVSGLYKNFNDLRVNKLLAAQSKQMYTYSLTILNKAVSEAIGEAVKAGGLTPAYVTFAANGAANAVGVLCPKMKTESYLLLDMKEEFSRFVFVAKGRACGYYSLPFGSAILEKPRLVAEEMLFHHDVAELAVLNAYEKAKAKQLTMTRDKSLDENATEEEKLDALFGDDEDASVDPTADTGAPAKIKTLPKKQPRKLPKFMQRPAPNGDEETVAENFRIFVKWALNLIASNDKLAIQGKPEKVYVNMPEDLGFLFEHVNAEAEENGITFEPLPLQGTGDKINHHLELFGGLVAGQVNRSNSFPL